MCVEDVRVFAATVAGVVTYEARKRAGSFPALLSRFEPAGRPRPLAHPERAVRLVTGLLRRLYGRRYCLPRSLVLYRLLRGAGAPVRLHTGVRSLGGGLDGHAWVSVGGIAVGEPSDPADLFALTFSHPASPVPGSLAHGPVHP